MDSSDFVAFTALLVIFGAPCAVWCISRVLGHRERMEMLRMGVVPPPNARDMRRAMKYGWTPGATSDASRPYGVPYQYDFAAQQQLRKGMQIAFIGLALLIGLGFIGYRGDGIFYPGPWLLGGLIPLFVGIAQVIGAVLSGASFTPLAGRPRFGPMGAPSTPPPDPQPGATVPPGPAYGGWRPGSTPEIEKPASPPDYRT
ncbi:MAG: hypothetical protein JOZ77_04945 [Candidatus Eremiobacteraeota bacterium]|nr:hypothetical protein [Candidatus Eremiobacteraeota bacterium]